MEDLTSFIQALPKAETHLHIEGSIPWALVRAASEEDLPPSPAWLHEAYRFADFTEFGLIISKSLRHVLTSPERYAEVAQRYFQQLVEQNVRYVEVSVSVGNLSRRGLNVAEVIDAVYSVVPKGLIVRVIGGMNRLAHVPLDSELAQDILETPGIYGLDMHGDERVNEPEAFREIYQAARDKGYLLKAHAGELTGADVIHRTLDALKVSRINHGTLGEDDEGLLERFIAEEITLDMCPTSNVKLGVVKSMAAHPIGKFLRRGIRVTCSTDDPPIFNTSINNELQQLVKHQGFTARELATLQINALQAAILPDNTRQALIAEVETLVATMETKN